MRWHTVDYRKRDRGDRRGVILDRGFWLNDVPRLIPRCRLFGHKPVVDGVDYGTVGHQSRWVCCDRCGIRPEPQGQLDPERYHVGDWYDGPFDGTYPTSEPARRAAHAELKACHHPPGPWPTAPTGTLGGQLVLGRTFSTGVEIKVGNPGSEQVLAGHISAEPLGALYLHTEQHGTWLQRRLNPHSLESRVTGFSAHGGNLYWKLWAPRDRWSREDPRWQQGSFRINPLDIVLGPKRYSYEDIGAPVPATLRMPHGDDHQVTMQLQRQTLARTRRRRPIEQAWTVDIDTHPGIPTKPGDRGRIQGFSVQITDSASEAGWAASALAEAAARMTRDRARYGYQSTPEAADV